MDDIYSSGNGAQQPPRRPRRPDRADTQELNRLNGRQPSGARRTTSEDIYFDRRRNQYEDVSSYSSEYTQADDGDLYLGGAQPQKQQRRGEGQTRRPASNAAQRPQQRPVARYAEPEDVSSGKQPKKKRKKMSCGCGCGAAALAVIALLLVAVIAGGSYLYSMLGDFKFDTEGVVPNQYIDEASLWQNEKVTNILLLGVDRREAEEASRSDTMMLLSIDRVNQKIKLTSFLRDMWVDIPGRKNPAKLNAASAYGGPQLVMDTIEYNFHVRVDHYILVDFEMFEKVVDLLGGVDVEVTEKEAAYLRSEKQYAPHPPVVVEPGPNTHLDGYGALWYSRIRYLDSDFMRTERQRKVVSAILAKAKDAGLTDLLKMAREVLPMVETNLSQKELASMAVKLAPALKYEMAQQQIPAENAYESGTRGGGQSVLLLDFERNRQILEEFLTN